MVELWIYIIFSLCLGFPGGSDTKEYAGLNPWVQEILWRRELQSTPVFLPGEFHGQRSLAGYGPWGLLLNIIK